MAGRTDGPVSWGRHSADDPRRTIREEIFQHDAGPVGPRRIIGFIYEAMLRDKPDTYHAYVGKCEGATEAAVTKRFHGRSPSAHTSPQSIAKDPWKADILPGRRGYRILERVRDTGDDRENDRALRRAEAFWIERLRTEHNVVRPARPADGRPRRPTRAPQAAARPAPRRQPTARRPPKQSKVGALVFLIVGFTALAAFLFHLLQLPWPAVPWVGSPVIGLTLGWNTYVSAHKKARQARRLLR